MVSKQFKELLEGYGEGNLLREVYGGENIIELGTVDAIRDLEGEKFYIEDMVRRLVKDLPVGYSKEELKEDANKYGEGLIDYLRDLGTTGYVETEVHEVVSLIHKQYGELILFNKDLVMVIEELMREFRYEDRKQLAIFIKFSRLEGTIGQPIRDKIAENAMRILRENESFNSGVNTENILPLNDYYARIEEELYTNGKKYSGNSKRIMAQMRMSINYFWYLNILEERVHTKGKDDAIKELIRMYPDKFRKKREVATCVVDLGNYYLTWLGSVRIISKEGTYTGYPKKMWEISSDSKEMILSWIDYNNLYKVFM